MAAAMPIVFEVYEGGKLVEELDVSAAVVVGPESTPTPGAVTFEGGRVSVSPDDGQPAGVMLPWDAGDAGCYTLETCRLPEREEPYLLSVELLRHRLMKILQKQEDWALYDLHGHGPTHLHERLARIKAEFAEALCLLPRPAEAAEHARAALPEAVVFSEELAEVHAGLLLSKRKTMGALPKNLMGIGADINVRSGKYRDTLAERADYARLNVGWKQLAPDEGEVVFDDLDEAVGDLLKRRLPVIIGPLVDLTFGNIPDWLVFYENDFDAVAEQAMSFVRKVIARYKGKVAGWEVVGHMAGPGPLNLDFEQQVELTRVLVGYAKKSTGGGRTLVQVRDVFGGYLGRGQGTSPMLYAEMVSQSGIPCDAFSVEVTVGSGKTGREMRDLFQLSCLLDRFAPLVKPLYITAAGCPGGPTEGCPSRWRRGWDADVQAEWLEAFYRLALSKPYVESVTWSDLSDEEAAVPGGGLLDDLLKPKPALKRMQQLRMEMRKARHDGPRGGRPKVRVPRVG